MIPRIIHQTWKTAEPEYWVFKKGQASVKKHLPDWLYKLWTDDDLERFVQQHYPRFFQSWLALDKHIKRVDVARLLILHCHGGLYCDLDVVWHQSPEPWLEGKSLVSYVSTQAKVKEWQFMGNAMMAAEPHHPFFLESVEWMFSLPPNSGVLFHTGPRALGKFLAEHGGGHLVTLFGPDLFDNEKCVDGIGKSILGCHIRAATWQHDRIKK